MDQIAQARWALIRYKCDEMEGHRVNTPRLKGECDDCAQPVLKIGDKLV